MSKLTFPLKKIKEGKAEIFVPRDKKISKKLPVFYNPIMKLNRDLCILFLKQFSPMHLCDPLAGTGVRAIRFAKELKYKSLTVNDIDKISVFLIKKNMKHNNVNFNVYNEDANSLLLNSKGFDFIELDVFGSPNFMLDSAVKRISRGGILAVTATDTAPLCGTYPKTCQRKYYAKPIRNEHMHEAGLRILIRKVQLIAAQYDKALTPLFSYSKDHYFRIYFKSEKGKTRVDKIISEHKYFLYCPNCLSFEVSNHNSKVCCDNHMDFAGPLYAGKINNANLIKKMKTQNEFVKLILKESKLNFPFFFDIHKIAKKYKLDIPKTEELISKIKKKKFKASKTHFNIYAIKTDARIKDLIKIMKD